MDYSKLSDFEINNLVDVAFHGETTPMRTQSLDFGITNYCINADQAWPIIMKNRISMVWDCAEDASSEWWNAFDQFDECRAQYQYNPLRAAMIVFLMIQESANVPVNSTGSDIR